MGFYLERIKENKRKQNVQIAKILGFVIGEDGQLEYPNDWRD
jgi:hypothetical protein